MPGASRTAITPLARLLSASHQLDLSCCARHLTERVCFGTALPYSLEAKERWQPLMECCTTLHELLHPSDSIFRGLQSAEVDKALSRRADCMSEGYHRGLEWLRIDINTLIWQRILNRWKSCYNLDGEKDRSGLARQRDAGTDPSLWNHAFGIRGCLPGRSRTSNGCATVPCRNENRHSPTRMVSC